MRLLPDPADPTLVATASFAEGEGSDPVSGLRPAIGLRHSSREPFTGEPVPEELLAGLMGAARAEGAGLSVLGEWQVDAVVEVARDAEQDESLSAGIRDEIARWTGPGADGSAGIPAESFGPRPHAGRAPVRDFAMGRPVPHRRSADFEQSPCLAVVGTPQDRPQDWLTMRPGPGTGTPAGDAGRAVHLPQFPGARTARPALAPAGPSLAHDVGVPPDAAPAGLRAA